ncbi:MAG: response regulator transcription factor [Pseudomonadota bacterium]
MSLCSDSEEAPVRGKPIIIADDHPLFRGALRQAIAGAAPDRDILEAPSLADARAAIDDAKPGLLCLDLHMMDSEGFAGLIALRQDHPALPVIVVSGSEADNVARRALAFGAMAFVPKSSDIDVIRAAIAAVLDGETWAPPGAEDAAPSAEADEVKKLSDLTPAQLKVLLLVHKGLLNKQIAYELDISEATVKAHMTAIMRKLDVQTRTQAAMIAGALLVETDVTKDDG